VGGEGVLGPAGLGPEDAARLERQQLGVCKSGGQPVGDGRGVQGVIALCDDEGRCGDVREWTERA
jgi:hypothetical protein